MKRSIFIFTIVSLYLIKSFAFEKNGINYNVISDNLTKEVEVIEKADKYSGRISIPNTIEYDGSTYVVSTIGDRAFFGCTALSEILIGDSIRHIGDYAFAGCSSLKVITIPSRVKSMGISILSAASSLDTINYNAIDCYFDFLTHQNEKQLKCSDVTPPPLNNNNVKVLNIGEEVRNILEGLINGCVNIESIGADNPNFIAKDDILYDRGQKRIFFCPPKKKGEVILSNSVKRIDGFAFSDCKNITSVIISDSINTILPYTFFGCESLSNITFPSSLKNIEGFAFAYCVALEYINLPFALEKIGESAFFNCKAILELELPNSLKEVEEKAFSYCSSLKKVSIGEELKSMSSSMFSYCNNLDTIIIGKRVELISYYALLGCKSLFTIISLSQTPPIFEENSFKDVPRNAKIKVACGSTTQYKYSMWNVFLNIDEIDECKSIKVSLSCNDTALGSVIGSGAYYKDNDVVIAAIPKSSVSFIQWSDGNKDNPRTLNLKEDVELIAIFQKSIDLTNPQHKQKILNVYPNPAQGFVNIELQDIKESVLYVMNIGGVIIDKININRSSMQEDIKTIDVSSYPNGVYFLMINNTIKKFVVCN